MIDDHELFRKGVANTLNEDSGIEVVAEGSTADDAVALSREFTPDLILLDVSMPGSGIAAARSIKSECPAVNIAMLTVSERDDDILQALNAGAQGYILKGIGGIRLLEIVRRLCRGESYMTPELAVRLFANVQQTRIAELEKDSRFFELTLREEQILDGVAKGLSNREIGHDLTLSEKTVKHHMTNVLKKLHVRNRVEAALLARNRHKKG